MRKVRAMAFSLATAWLALVPGAHAQQQPPQPEHPCAADARRLCQAEEIACLKAHKSELSPQCKMKVLKAAEKREQKQIEEERAPQPPPQ